MPSRLSMRVALSLVLTTAVLAGPVTSAEANPGCMSGAVGEITINEGSTTVDPGAVVARDCPMAQSIAVGDQPSSFDPRWSQVSIAVGGASTGPFPFTITAGGDFFTTPASGPVLASLSVTGNGGTQAYALRITVTNVPDPVTCAGLAATTTEDTATPPMALGCSDADGEAITGLAIATQPAHGMAALADGSYTYTPAPNFNGTDGFTVDVTQGATHTIVTVAVVVTSVADATRCMPLTLRAHPGRTISAKVSCTDGDGPVSLAIGRAPARGRALLANGFVTYVPNGRSLLADLFRLDARQGGVVATLFVKVLVVAPATAGNDQITATDAADAINGGLGNDTIDGIGGNDVLSGGAGNDVLRGSAGADRLVGGAGTDTHAGGVGSDSINSLDAPGVRDIVSCGDGVDTVTANRSDVVLQDCERVTRRP